MYGTIHHLLLRSSLRIMSKTLPFIAVGDSSPSTTSAWTSPFSIGFCRGWEVFEGFVSSYVHISVTTVSNITKPKPSRNVVGVEKCTREVGRREAIKRLASADVCPRRRGHTVFQCQLFIAFQLCISKESSPAASKALTKSRWPHSTARVARNII